MILPSIYFGTTPYSFINSIHFLLAYPLASKLVVETVYKSLFVYMKNILNDQFIPIFPKSNAFFLKFNILYRLLSGGRCQRRVPAHHQTMK
jgi:hypothetical protein